MPNLDDDGLGQLGHLNHIEFSRELTRSTGNEGVILEEGGLVLHAAANPFPVLFNGVWRVDPGLPADRVIARADAFFAERHRGYSLILRDEDAEDDDLRAIVEGAGMHAVLRSPEMLRRSRVDERPLPPGVELRWVEDRPTFDDFVAISDAAYATQGLPVGTLLESIVALRAFTVPHVHTVVAYLDGDPVAAAQTILSHSIAGVFWVGTIEGARGTGLGDAVTRAVTNCAFDQGARAVSLQASNMGEPIYRRMGYETLYHYTTFARFEPPAPA